ncbi:exodeoxyribonuclease VII large subunit [Lampropedia puyangensis]|uniref:Exodeoxyribonuclease 7 large subunit n=1 Tax=Lampropedia puyangensis TaxID=1330072 RepID=A0A4S8ERU2_9BURK|nr:exodeoxyribonuclease VII large subunit [Lampropedia puyangensis]THT96194.1 exodeoxyribonuclease VII large subunit [Lampropedia puyangensis]
MAATVWPVGALCLAIGDALQARFHSVTVEGEISGLTRAASGHWYFSLKDERGQLRCAMFRRAASMVSAPIQEGDRVVAQARVTVYEPRGDLQLVVEALRPAGLGNLYEQFLRLKAQLQQEGLFEQARKRQPVGIPRAIAVVTSLNAAAWHDIMTALRRRAPHVPVLLVPALVQGSEAPASLRQALQKLYEAIAQGSLKQSDGSAWNIDTIIVARGGGSIEDLWAFNDPQLARLIVQSPVPLIAGIGHETDFTIADWCADVRAPTPTAAAELAALPAEQLLQGLNHHHDRLSQTVDRQMLAHERRIQAVGQMFARPSAWLARHAARLERTSHALQRASSSQWQRQSFRLEQCALAWPRAVQSSLHQQAQRLEQAGLRLRMLDPQQVLERGYAIATNAQGSVVRDVQEVEEGQILKVRLARGAMTVQVK